MPTNLSYSQSPVDGGLSYILEEPPAVAVPPPVFAKEALQPPPRARASSLTAKLAEEKAASGLLQLHQFSPATGQWETRPIDPPQLPSSTPPTGQSQVSPPNAPLPASTPTPTVHTPRSSTDTFTWQMTQMMATASVGEVTRALVRMCWRLGGGMRLPGQSDLSTAAPVGVAYRDAPLRPVAFAPPTAAAAEGGGGAGAAAPPTSAFRPRSATDSGTVGAALASFVLRVFEDGEVELDLPPPAREAPLAKLGEEEFAICTVADDVMVLHLKLQLTHSKAGAPVLRLFFRRPPPPGVLVQDPSPVPGSASGGGSPSHDGGGHPAGFISNLAHSTGSDTYGALTGVGESQAAADETVLAPPTEQLAAPTKGVQGGPLRRWSGSTEVFTPVPRRQGSGTLAPPLQNHVAVGGGNTPSAPPSGAGEGGVIKLQRRAMSSSGSASKSRTSNSSLGFLMSDEESEGGGDDEDEGSPESPGGSGQLRVQTTGRWGAAGGSSDVHVAFSTSAAGTFSGALGSVAAAGAEEPRDMMQQIAAYRSQRYAAQRRPSTGEDGALIETLVAGLGGREADSATPDDGSGMTDDEALAAALAEVDGY